MLDSLREAVLAHNVVSGNMRVTCIDARAYGNDSVEAGHNFGDLLEASAERELRSGGVFDQNRQASLGKVEPFGGCSDGSGGAKQSLFAVGAAKRAGMEHEIIRAERKRALDFATEGQHRLMQEKIIRARHVYEIVGV